MLFITIIITTEIDENDNRNFIKQFSVCDFFHNGGLSTFVFGSWSFSDIIFNFNQLFVDEVKSVIIY